MQQELLRYTGRSPPVRRQLAHFGFRGQTAVEVGSTDGFPDSQVAGHDAGAPQGARQEPFGGPASEATTGCEAGDDICVGLVPERCQIQAACSHRSGQRDDVFGLAGGELQRAQGSDSGGSETCRIKAKDLMRAERVLASKRFSQATPGNRGPTQIDLLGADSAYKGSEQVGLQDRAQTSVACFETRDDWINGGEFGEWIRSRNEHRSYCLFYSYGMGRALHSDVERRRIDRPPHGASERDNRIPNPRSAYQGMAVPAINPVITRTAEDFE